MAISPQCFADDKALDIMNIESALAVLFLSSLLAGSVLPGGSEVVLFGALKLNIALFWPAIITATIGNTLGGLTSYAIGRFLPAGKSLPAQTLVQRVKRYGSPILLLAWTPWIGDPLCVAAGWLRLNVWQCIVFMAIGKFARYWLIAIATR
jgi:membrane protein YqaA with SNARE-associated domain